MFEDTIDYFLRTCIKEHWWWFNDSWTNNPGNVPLGPFILWMAIVACFRSNEVATKAACKKNSVNKCPTVWATMSYFNQNITVENKRWRIQMSKNLSFRRLWYFCIIKKERVSSALYMIWLLHWWNYLSWNKLICLSGTEDILITHLSKILDYVWRNWQLIITHNSRQRFESLQKKIDETQSKLGTVIHSKSWWEKADK